MDIATVLGYILLFVLVAIGIATGEISSIFFNVHGIGVVIGGCMISMLLNTPMALLLDAMKAFFVTLRSPKLNDPAAVIPLLVGASQNVHARGLNALGGLDPNIAQGFLARAATVAMEFKEPKYVEDVLGAELRREFEHHNEIVNVYRTLSILFPMFGLIGTLLGIVQVLKEISNPEQVGPAMAVAITSAFYGISAANLFATPAAGKIRLKFLEEYLVKAIIIEGMAEILKGTVPVLVEERLNAYLLDKKK